MGLDVRCYCDCCWASIDMKGEGFMRMKLEDSRTSTDFGEVFICMTCLKNRRSVTFNVDSPLYEAKTEEKTDD